METARLRRLVAPVRTGALRAILTRRKRSWSGTVYRAVPLAFADPIVAFSGKGARQVGGRWNPPGRLAIYASLVPEHAFAERLALARRNGAPDREVLPTAVLSAEVELEAVLAWSELSIDERGELDPSNSVTTIDWVSANARGECALPQMLGEVASMYGAEGLVVPSSAVTGALVLVLYPHRFRERGRVRVQEPP